MPNPNLDQYALSSSRPVAYLRLFFFFWILSFDGSSKFKFCGLGFRAIPMQLSRRLYITCGHIGPVKDLLVLVLYRCVTVHVFI
jgi:hypothetical protein